MSEGRSCVLASESAQEQDGWIGLMTAILTSNKNALEAKKSNSTVTSPDGKQYKADMNVFIIASICPYI